MSLPHLSHPKYRHDIDGLRAVAVLAVVAFHAFPNWMKGGFVGVDIFFVISGYLISIIIFENLDKGTFSFTEFYARRVKRIFPALILVLSSCFAFGWFALLADEYKQLGKHIAGSTAFVSNFVLWNESGYFDNVAATKPLLHLWSLGIEEQFYIIWPFLLWFAYKKRFNLLSISALVAIISFCININQVKTNVVADFYSPQTRFWELILGSILAWLKLYKPSFSAASAGKLDKWFFGKAIFRNKQENDGKTLASAISVLALLLLAYGFWHINKDMGFPGKWAVIPVSGAILIIFAGPDAWVNRVVLSNKFAVWFGLISYPIYLWHWPLLSFARIIEGETPSRYIRIAAVLMSIILAWITYKFIECPIRFGRNTQFKLVGLILSMLIVSSTGSLIFFKDGLENRSLYFMSEHAPPAEEIMLGSSPWMKSYSQNSICTQSNGFGANSYNIFCIASGPEPDVLLLGDSHANQLYPGLLAALGTKHQFLSINDAAPLSDTSMRFTHKVGHAWQNMDKDILGGLEVINRNKSISTVLIAAQWNPIIRGQFASDNLRAFLGDIVLTSFDNSIDSNDHTAIFKNGIKLTISKILSMNRGINIVLVLDTPEPLWDPKLCLKNIDKCSYPREVQENLREQVMHVSRELKDEYPSVKIFDPFPLLCSKDSCPLFKNGHWLYRDESHISVYGSKIVGKSLSHLLN